MPVAKLDYVEAQDDYVSLASGGKTYLKQQPISSLEAALHLENRSQILASTGGVMGEATEAFRHRQR